LFLIPAALDSRMAGKAGIHSAFEELDIKMDPGLTDLSVVESRRDDGCLEAGNRCF
jgi:hypothetical protein